MLLCSVSKAHIGTSTAPTTPPPSVVWRVKRSGDIARHQRRTLEGHENTFSTAKQFSLKGAAPAHSLKYLSNKDNDDFPAVPPTWCAIYSSHHITKSNSTSLSCIWSCCTVGDVGPNRPIDLQARSLLSWGARGTISDTRPDCAGLQVNNGPWLLPLPRY